MRPVRLEVGLMAKIHKMISLDRETYNIAQKIPNFSGYVRNILLSNMVSLEDCSNQRLIGVVLYRMQKQFGFESQEAIDMMEVLHKMRALDDDSVNTRRV